MLARETPDGFRAAHRRRFEHLIDTTPEFPNTPDELQRLYQAVWHGCKAGRHAVALNVLVTRIRVGDHQYNIRRYGNFQEDLASIANFFDGYDYTLPVADPDLKETDRALVLNVAAFDLLALGRLRAAEQPMTLGMNANEALKDWANASRSASRLAELSASRSEERRV